MMHRHSVKMAKSRTVSRFSNRMSESTLERLDQIDRQMRQILYSIKKPEQRTCVPSFIAENHSVLFEFCAFMHYTVDTESIAKKST